MNEATSLYRHFAADGTLLYVGISLSWPARTKAHAAGSRWFEQVAAVKIEQFPTRGEALQAERKAIQQERPRYNIIHNREKPAKTSRRRFSPALREVSADALSLLSPKERERYKRQLASERACNPALRTITGPHAIVGPALRYHADKISVLIAHGQFGTPGELTEIVLGDYVSDELPEWTRHAVSVLTIRRADEITISEGQQLRRGIVQMLKSNLETVFSFDTDLTLATAYAARFPSDKSRCVLREVAGAPLMETPA